MTRFSYILNPETNLVERAILETYPTLDILQRGINAKRALATIQKGLLRAYQGVAETNLVSKEEEWYEAHSKIVDLTAELEQLNNPELQEDDNGVDIPLTEEQLNTISDRKRAILGHDETTIVKDGTDIITHIDGEIEIAVAERDSLEISFEFLKGYRGETTDAVRPLVTSSIPWDVTKRLIAYERDQKIRNQEDSIADLAKMNSLLFSMVSAMYTAGTTTMKSNIPAETRGIIEHAITKFSETQTRADRQLAEEGAALIDKLFDREVQIADIIDNI